MCWNWLFGGKKIISAGNKRLCKRNIFEQRTVGVTKIIFEKYGAFFLSWSSVEDIKTIEKPQLWFAGVFTHYVTVTVSVIVLPSWCWQYWATLRFIFCELRKLFDISSWSRYVVLRCFFCKWGRKESGKGSGAISRRPDEQFIHPHDQWSSLPPLFIPSSFTIPRFTRRGARSLFFFRPRHNGGMVMSAQSNTLSGPVHVSVCGWLTMLGC